MAGKAHRVGVTGSEPSYIEYKGKDGTEKEVTPLKTHRQAAALILRYLRDRKTPLNCIGHRYVHGGSQFATSAIIDDDCMKLLRRCLPLAPIHNPISLSVIEESQEVFPDLTQYVSFDTAFHSSLPERAYTYALPARLRRQYGFRKFGFHGLSYTYVTRKAADYLCKPLEKTNMVACHLGTGGSSVAAVEHGRSIDTSMGYSPLAGLIMSTRSGDIDPMLLTHLMANYDVRADDLESLLNKKSGLIGLSEFSSDLRDILARVRESEQKQAALAFEMYCHRLKKYIGSYIMALGGIHALIFTDDIGVTNAQVREKVCVNLAWAGIKFDAEKNQAVTKDRITVITTDDSPVPVLVVPTDEEIVIVWEGIKLLQGVLK
jgi:acetate kinase